MLSQISFICVPEVSSVTLDRKSAVPSASGGIPHIIRSVCTSRYSTQHNCVLPNTTVQFCTVANGCVVCVSNNQFPNDVETDVSDRCQTARPSDYRGGYLEEANCLVVRLGQTLYTPLARQPAGGLYLRVCWAVRPS